uniref:Spermidine synthase n=1 Tax=Dolomedes sulfureus TaxID=492288 RepID=A0A0P0DIW6_9ARAC|nr:spermidine synthase [Dolomedes sulfureus]
MSSEVSSGDKRRKFGVNAFKENWFSENGTLAEDFAWSIEIKKVLIIGGGDGGVARELSKHPSVQSIVLCEIDEAVIRASKRHLPFMSKGFQSPKLTVNIGDGVEYVRKQKGQFDVIITDSSDPVGLAADVHEKPYFESLKSALRPGGVVAAQGGCYWFDIEKTRELLDACRSVFPVVDYAFAFTPSSPGGQCGFLLCGVAAETNFREPMEKLTSQTLKDFGFRYYTPRCPSRRFCTSAVYFEGTGPEGGSWPALIRGKRRGNICCTYFLEK